MDFLHMTAMSHTPAPTDLGPVTEPPADLPAARTALHRLAAYVIAPARHRVTGRFGLRWHPHGFTTPSFDGRTITVAGDQIVDDRSGVSNTTTVTTLDDASAFLGEPIDTETAAEHDSPAIGDASAALPVRPDHAEWLANWWGIGVRALETVIDEPASVDPGQVQLWPGHFDVGVEIGDEHRRSSYGASAGDEANAVPYLYVSVWWPDRLTVDRNDPYWTAEGYVGASLAATDLIGVDDPVAAAAEFYRTGRDLLVAATATPPTEEPTS